MEQFEDCEEDLIRQLEENRIFLEEELQEREEYEEYFANEYDYDDVSRPLTGDQLQKSAPNAQPLSTKLFQPKSTQGFISKIDLDSHLAPSEQTNRKKKDKKDRATVENTIDKTTLQSLIKIMKNKMVKEINGCLSTGKEANVYHAFNPENTSRAIKIFRTSIQIFKNRSKYMTDDHRFMKRDFSVSNSNSRSMVYMWAEREYRNLKRMHEQNLPCPEPFFWDKNVVLMQFLGENERPAPLLKNVEMTDSLARTLYIECINLLWDMYNKCNLVHCDFSEYNLLYHQNKVYIIDVSASIESEAFKAPQFLKLDCKHINRFFESYDVATMGAQELFDYITDVAITEENRDEHLDRIKDRVTSRSAKERQALKEKDALFLETLTVTSMKDISYEGDQKKLIEQTKNSIYATLLGKKDDTSLIPQLAKNFNRCVKNTIARNNESEEEESDCSESEDEEDSEEDVEDEEEEEGVENSKSPTRNKKEKVGARPRNESPNSRKVRKQAVKVENKEKRQKKIKKKEKKRLIGKTKR